MVLQDEVNSGVVRKWWRTRFDGDIPIFDSRVSYSLLCCTGCLLLAYCFGVSMDK